MTRASSYQMPGIWSGVRWAADPAAHGSGISRPRLVWRALRAALWHGKALRRWMTVVFELQSRGVVKDLPGEYLRAVRPYVRRRTGYNERVIQLIDHVDWVESALRPAAYERLASGQPLVLAQLPAPKGYEFLRIQLTRAAVQSPEGELLITLTLQRAPEVKQRPRPVDLAVLAFSRFRVDGAGCLAIGGVRGQRHPVLRLSPIEVSQALQGWKPAVLLVRVAQELARHWGLHLLGLDPRAHQLQGWTYRWSRRHRRAAQRLSASYDGLWNHFEAKPGPQGWMILPIESDEKLAATALSPEKRARQTRRADYWMRIRKLMFVQFRESLRRPSLEASVSRVTQSLALDSIAPANGAPDFPESRDATPSRVLETGPGSVI